MKRGLSGGYTIVEVMMFLVISGVLLLTAMFVFNGQQQRTQFTQTVREFEGQLRTIINEVSSGFYPNNADFSCSVPPGQGPLISDATARGQGTNTGCIFMGKVLRFENGGNYSAYTVVGRRQTDAKEEVTTLDAGKSGEAKQTLIGSQNGGGPSSEQKYTLGWGATVTAVHNTSAGTNIGALAFLMSLGSYKSSSDLVSGSQTVDAYPLAGTSLGASVNQLKSATTALHDSDRNHSGLVVCLRSGAGDRQAAILVGGNSRQLSVDSVIFENDNPYGCPTYEN